MAKPTLAFFLFCSLTLIISLALTGCGGTLPSPLPTVHAQALPVLNCTSPAIFRGADDGVQSFAAFTLCNFGQTDGDATTDVTYTIGHDFTVDSITTWLGTAQGSIEETAGEITVETPTGVAGQYRTKWIILNQKDKHKDVEGERIEHFPIRLPTLLPAGTRIVFHMNIGVINASKNCPQSGCAVQLNVYMNGQ